MLGSSLLVAPIFDPSGTVQYYVPAGRWVGLLDGKARVGPGWFTETHGFDSLPVLVRPGGAILKGLEENTAEYDFRENGFEVVTNEVPDEHVIEVRVGTNGQEVVKVTIHGGDAKVDGLGKTGTVVRL